MKSDSLPYEKLRMSKGNIIFYDQMTVIINKASNSNKCIFWIHNLQRMWHKLLIQV